MARSTNIKATAGILAALLLGACSSNDSELPRAADPVGPPAPPAQVAFTGFVKLQFRQTADNANPADVESQNLIFTDNDNSAAYDDLLDPR